MNETKETVLLTRVEPSVKLAFRKKCEPFGSPSIVLRELILAFNEDRLTIDTPNNPLFNKRK
jgi:hypothetical protein